MGVLFAVLVLMGSARAERPTELSTEHAAAASTSVDSRQRLIERDWRPACDGSVLKIILQGEKILKIEASAMHHQLLIEWTVSFKNKVPDTATYRVYDRPRLRSGDRAGEATGALLLKTLQVWRANGGDFRIVDPGLAAELKRLLKEVDELKVGKPSEGEGGKN